MLYPNFVFVTALGIFDDSCLEYFAIINVNIVSARFKIINFQNEKAISKKISPFQFVIY